VPQATVISEDIRQVDAVTAGDRLLIRPEDLGAALGWELKPEGLCHGDTCVPVRDRGALLAGDRLDLAAVAGALGRPVVVDAGAAVAAVALGSEQRRQALDGLVAPEFTLPDLAGRPHAFSEWSGRKRLLVAFASW